MIKDINQSLLLTLTEREFPQNPLLTPQWFVQHLNERTSKHVLERELEALDRAGVFCPLVKVQHSSSYHRITARDENGQVVSWKDEEVAKPSGDEDDEIVQVFQTGPESQEDWRLAREEGRITICNPETFEPWKNFAPPYPETRTATVYYHAFQAFRFFADRSFGNAYGSLLDPNFTAERAYDIFAHWQEQLNKIKEDIQSDNKWKQQLLLLLFIEDRYLPILRESVVYNNLSYRRGKNWEQWSQQFDAQGALAKSGISLDSVKQFHKEMAFQARANDDYRELFPLLRHMPYTRRKGIKGNARRVWDYYEITELIGDFLADITGQRQRLPDDVTTPDYWKEGLFGIPAEEMDYKRGNALPGIARYFGLDPRNRVWLFVEGESEVAFIRT